MKPSATVRQHRGFAMVLVLFILVALAALAVTMRDLSVAQHLETVQSQNVREAQFAARSALEWTRATVAGGVPSCSAGNCQGLPATLTIDAISITLDCNCLSFVELDQTYEAYEVSAHAVVSPGTMIEAQRTLRGTVLR